ncbi:uncharacterized protein BJ212DRAFT_1585790, partial [Suillus subaureus]
MPKMSRSARKRSSRTLLPRNPVMSKVLLKSKARSSRLSLSGTASVACLCYGVQWQLLPMYCYSTIIQSQEPISID